MIPFFRKIRKQFADDNKPLKYMRYAIGEIVLVVIGILIALSINNWNEGRKEKKELGNYLIQMTDELVLDTLFYSNYIEENKERIRILTSASQGNYSEIDIESLPKTITLISTDKNFGITYESLKTQGMFDQIDNIKLKNEIAFYYELNCQVYSEWIIWQKKFVTETIESYVALNLPVSSRLTVNSEKLINEIENGQLLSLINYQIYTFASISSVMEGNKRAAKELILQLESEVH